MTEPGTVAAMVMRYPPVPRLGRGIVWSDIVAEIEKEQELRIENGGRLSRYDRRIY